MSRAIAFLGNRYSPLSRIFYEALRDCIAPHGLTIVVVDTSMPLENRVSRRTRNSLVAIAKKWLGVKRPTAAVDWLTAGRVTDGAIVIPNRHTLSDRTLPDRLRQLGVSAALVAGCDQVLRRPLIDAIPRIVNYHNSLLPRYRGCDAVSWAMLSGEKSIGFSFHTIESERVDAGRVLVQGQVSVQEDDTPVEIDMALARAAASRLNDLLGLMLGGSWGMHGCAIEGGDYYRRGQIEPFRIFDPRLTRVELHRRMRVFGSLSMPSRSPLRITDIEATEGQTGSVQELGLAVGECRVEGRSVVVGCADGPMAIKTVQFLPARLFAFLLEGSMLPTSGVAPSRSSDGHMGHSVQRIRDGQS